jgi:polyisoprenoid-binding protein YceI
VPKTSCRRWALAAWLVASTLPAAGLAQAKPAAAPAATPAKPAVVQTLVPAQSEVTFVAKQMGVPLDGRFQRFSVASRFDPKALASSQIGFTLDLGSVAINPETNAELAKPEWFHTARFPQASFQSSAFKALGGGRFEVAGQLSLKGQVRPLTVPVQITQAQGLSTATGSFTLKRLAFNIGGGDWGDPSIVADEVQVRFKLVLQGVPPL